MVLPCPCGSALSFAECCQALHNSERVANTPEELMRARYSAYVNKDIAFLKSSMDPQTAQRFDEVRTREWAEAAEFYRLEIVNSLSEGTKGTVEFRAHYRNLENLASPHVHHELSRFRKQAGHWYFREGRVINPS